MMNAAPSLALLTLCCVVSICSLYVQVLLTKPRQIEMEIIYFKYTNIFIDFISMYSLLKIYIAFNQDHITLIAQD